jgi:hypothetical protein
VGQGGVGQRGGLVSTLGQADKSNFTWQDK